MKYESIIVKDWFHLCTLDTVILHYVLEYQYLDGIFGRMRSKILDIYLSADSTMNTPIIEQLRFVRRANYSFDSRKRFIRFVSSFNIILTRKPQNIK